MFKKVLLISTISFLTACAGTVYQPLGTDMTGGYYHQKYETNYYNVGFVGNGFSDANQVYDYTMLRAAELGRELGFKYFIVEGMSDETTDIEIDGPTTVTATPTYNGGFTGTAYTNTTTVSKPGYSLDIRYYDAKPSPRDGQSYSVQGVSSDLKTKYGI